MEVKDLVINDNIFKASFKINIVSGHVDETSPAYVLRGVAQMRVRIVAMDNHACILLKVSRMRIHDESEYRLRVSNNYGLAFEQMIVYANDIWHLLSQKNNENVVSFDLCAYVEVGTPGGWFSGLLRYTAITDFELKGIDGAVPVHRAALAAASPVLNAMLSGPWRESSEGTVNAKVSSATLGLFKEFIYTGMLPEVTREDLEPLMLLASLYLMPELEQLCVDRLMKCADDTTAVDLLEFAVEHKMTRLTIGVLERVQAKTFSFSGIHRALKDTKRCVGCATITLR